MAPALTEATASPESSRKNSVDRHYSSTVQGEFKQENSGRALDLKLVSQNGLVRFISDNNIADITNTIKPSEQNTPIVSKLAGDLRGKIEMPNGHCDEKLEKSAADMSSYSTATEEKRNSCLDLPRTTCASTAKTSAGTCNTVCENEEKSRVSQHPVANLESGKALIPQRTTLAFRRQGKLDGRARRIETRLRKLQARQLSDHVLQQLENLAEKRGESRDSSSINLEPVENSGVGIIPESKSTSNISTKKKSRSSWHQGRAWKSCKPGDKQQRNQCRQRIERTGAYFSWIMQFRWREHLDGFKTKIRCCKFSRKLEFTSWIFREHWWFRCHRSKFRRRKRRRRWFEKTETTQQTVSKFYYVVESMFVFGSEKEISFRILLIIVKKRGSGNSAVKFIRDETFPIHWMEDFRFLPILGLSPSYIQLLKLTRDFSPFSHLKL